MMIWQRTKNTFSTIATLILCLGALFPAAEAVSVDFDSQESICDAAALVIGGILDYYEGSRYGGTVGMFQAPYYWWESGEVFGGLLGTWFFCENNTYESLIYDGLLAQKGSKNNYIPANQSTTEGNDDQAFWGIAVLEAAERNFTNPSGDDYEGVSWLGLAQAVYNTMWENWDTQHCGGGLRWQKFTWNSGYDYKNTVSNAGLFHIAARLYRYTGNETYLETAETVYEWLKDVNFVTGSDAYSVYDGANIGTNNCSTLSESKWSYNYGLLIGGAAYLYNGTEGDEQWLSEIDKLYAGITNTFLANDTNIMYEYQCQQSGTCNNDQRSFKSIFSRCLGYTAKLVPSYTDKMMTILRASAKGAAQSCSGGSDGHTCGMNWAYNGWDGWYGLGEQLSALEVMQQNLLESFDAPYRSDNGGSSESHVDAGIDADTTTNYNEMVVKQKDKVGAGIVTAIVLVVLLALSIWMII